jgi:pimeloyl-ACP methyl ester carboxylesterase
MYEEIEVDRYRSPGPSAWHSITELPRVMLELTSLSLAWPLLGMEPRGDGHPVLVLPGFMAGDESTLLLRRFLGGLGYRPLPWELGRNVGSLDQQSRLVDRFDRLTRRHGERVSVIGQSLGGVFARELARQFEDRVRLTVTLGSPFASSGPESTNPVVARLFQYLSGLEHEHVRERMLEAPLEPPPVPSTAVYSRTDGVVHWSTCLEYPGELAESIEIVGSHTGMAVNPAVLHVVADRLAQPEGGWKPFERDRGWRSLIFPRPRKPR